MRDIDMCICMCINIYNLKHVFIGINIECLMPSWHQLRRSNTILPLIYEFQY